ncbi:MAG: OPT/YSL family transporter [Steroidobacteraceae bacterium]
MIAAANTYLGLFATGMAIASAIPATVISMAVLRLLGSGSGQSTLLENNIVQTGASAGSSIASGVIFTIPALIILGYWQDFWSQYWWVLAIARPRRPARRAVLGAAAPRSLIVEQQMAFPEGKAASRSAAGRRGSGTGREDPRRCRARWRRGEARRGERPQADPGHGGGSRLPRQLPRLLPWPTCRRRCSASATSSG